ncbi:MAG: transcription antitermination factor NusB [Nitriliruptoraceae bacterium]
MLFQADLRGVAPSVTLDRMDRDPAARSLLDERDSLTEEVPIVPPPDAAPTASPARPAEDTSPAASARPREQAPPDTPPSTPGADPHRSAAASPHRSATASPDRSATASPDRSAAASPDREDAATSAGGGGRASGWTETPVRDSPPALDGFTRGLVLGVESHRAAIEDLITRYSRRWAISRMPVVDRNVLRLATYELLHEPTPAAVVIDEAIDLAKRLSTEDSGRFVNGVLESIRKELTRARSGAADEADG